MAFNALSGQLTDAAEFRKNGGFGPVSLDHARSNVRQEGS
jgi:hypothetical protein